MEPRIIALYAPAPGMGKSTVAHHLFMEHGFIRRSFADPIKSMLTDFLMCNHVCPDRAYEYLYGREKEMVIPEIGLSGRRLMQSLGVEWGRHHVGFDVWVKTLMAEIAATPSHRRIVIDDMRFRNEYTALNAVGAEFWVIERDGVELNHDHASDGLLDGALFTRRIDNSGDIAALKARIDGIMQQQLNKRFKEYNI